ncbi:O-antigen ligase family protein [Aquabacter sp. CN5-332]|uniref:O-antigen ligase family protein n=1 Tax=Aquabacter sp. CN5-332 TaxID=3156608 RepID=UPI0032B4420F
MREPALPAGATGRPLPDRGRQARPARAAERSAERRADASLEDGLFLLLLAELAFAPFWFGGNRPFAWMVNAVVWSGLILAYEAALTFKRRPYPVPPARLAPVLALMACVLAWILAQCSPLMPVGMHNPLWPLAAGALDMPVGGAISIDPDTTKLALLTLLPPAAAFWLALQLGRESRRARLAVLGFAGISAAYAAYAIFSLGWFPTRLLWVRKEYYLDSATGTFVNRNSYATYAGMGLLASLSALSSMIARIHDSAYSWKRWISLLLTRSAIVPGLLLCAVMLNGMALMLTGSRAGIASSLLGVIVYYLLHTCRKGFRWPQAVSLGAAALVILVVVLQYDDLVSQRLQAQGVLDAVRLAILRLGLTALGDQPLAGFGFGTFEESFRLYRDASLPGALLIDKAHNTYLEAALGLGLPAFALLMAALILLVALCVRGSLIRRKDEEIPLLAAAVSVTVGVHAMVDFSLQMQGVAVTYAMLLGVGASQSWPSEKPAADAARAAIRRPAGL